MPKAAVPRTGTEPKAPTSGNPLTGPRPARRYTPAGVRARRQRQPIEAEESQELEEQEAAHQRAAAQEAERERLARQQEELARQREQERRARQEELARQREHELELVRLRAQQEAAARERRDAEDRKAKERRRATLQRVKDQVIARYWSIDYTIPEETKAHALAEIEKELARLSVDDLPEAELVTIAAGIRDRIYKPVIQAQDRAKAEEARKQHQARQRADLIESGLAYARLELRREQDLDAWTRSDIERKVEEILEQEIDGRESEAEVRDLVDETLDETLDEADEERRAKARPKLIAHGSAYAMRELAHEKELDVWERSRIERQVKQELEGEITGDESERDVEALVDDILDEELGEIEDDEEP